MNTVNVMAENLMRAAFVSAPIALVGAALITLVWSWWTRGER